MSQGSNTSDSAPYADSGSSDIDESELVTNDAVAGETVLDGAGSGNTGPTGGSPGEVEPSYAPNDLEDEDIDLDDEPDDGANTPGIGDTQPL